MSELKKIPSDKLSVLVSEFLVGSILFIVIGSIIGLTAFILGAFNGSLICVLSFVLVISSYSFWKGIVYQISLKSLMKYIAIGALFFILRFPPYLAVHGGQDQGVYISMSKHILNNGGPFFKDRIRKNYDDNIVNDYDRMIKDGWTGVDSSEFQPGVYNNGFNTGRKLIDPSADYVFQFYHLGPVWMALVDSILPGDRGHYSMLLFSLLSIVFLCLILYEVAVPDYAVFCTFSFLSLNPVFVLFSKWPLTEIVSLAFVSAGLWLLLYLVRRWKSNNRFYLLLGVSTLLFSLSFFVRMSGFIFLPFLAILFGVGLYFYFSKDRRHIPLLSFSFGSTLIYGLSFLYGLVFSPYYVLAQYHLEIFSIKLWMYIAVGSFVLFGLSTILAFYTHKRSVHKNVTFRNLSITCSIAIAVIMLISFFKFCNIDSKNLLISQYSGMFILTSLGVLLPVTTILVLFQRKSHTKVTLILQLLLLAPFVYILILKPVVYYYFYYSRYMISELIPFASILMFYILRDNKKILIGLTTISCIIFLFMNFKYSFAKEGRRAYEILSEVDKEVGENTLILDADEAYWKSQNQKIGREFNSQRLFLPLYFYYGLNVMPFKSEKTRHENVYQFAAFVSNESKDEVYVLSPRYINNGKLQLIETYTHKVSSLETSRDLPLLVRNDYWLKELYLYKILPDECSKYFIEFYDDNIWTNGDSKVIYRCSENNVTGVKIETYGYRPIGMVYDDFIIRINNNETMRTMVNENEYLFNLPLTISDNLEVEIISETFQPDSINKLSDRRILGVDIKSIELIYKSQ